MKSEQLKAWMERNNLSTNEVFRITDNELTTLNRYVSGKSSIPKAMHLACIAFDEGICPWG